MRNTISLHIKIYMGRITATLLNRIMLSARHCVMAHDHLVLADGSKSSPNSNDGSQGIARSAPSPDLY
jgi:hypothetical protein